MVTYGPGGLSKHRWWPILSGDVENPPDDIVIGWAPGKWHHRGFTFKEMHPDNVGPMTTEEVLKKCNNRAYSLKEGRE